MNNHKLQKKSKQHMFNKRTSHTKDHFTPTDDTGTTQKDKNTESKDMNRISGYVFPKKKSIDISYDLS